MLPIEKLNDLETEYEQLKDSMSDPNLLSDQRRFREISRRFKELSDIFHSYDQYRSISKQFTECEEMLRKESDPEMQEMFSEEKAELSQKLENLEKELNDLLIPSDPNDSKNAIVEIRAGTGGEEAALFAAELFRMYSYYAERMKWKLKVMDMNETGLGGFKEIIFLLSGENVYGTMRFESGVHRVQRVPQTEAGGRIHTSAVSVAVLPEADEVDIEIKDNEIRVDVFRSSGNGGQSVNTTDSAVRITHIPTGIVVTCQDEKSQLKNKEKAMNVLRSRLLDMEISKQEAAIASSRKAQVGTGDRSAKIRTYNFPQSRVTDHRINLTTYNIDAMLHGELDEFIMALKTAYREEKVNS
ncbi:MAG TPA: peptide chain release factor 1 [Candidatus Cloacimonadota bacterium]|nr:peptide chain release factor 1 [Candidatus Cloacimonadota bacterium]HPT71405.1 peptide chain release factor 1 [Candidatus Cloacimonadota bacterium]